VHKGALNSLWHTHTHAHTYRDMDALGVSYVNSPLSPLTKTLECKKEAHTHKPEKAH